MAILQRHRFEQARKANLARELEQAREEEAFIADLPDLSDVLSENAAEQDRDTGSAK